MAAEKTPRILTPRADEVRTPQDMQRDRGGEAADGEDARGFAANSGGTAEKRAEQQNPTRCAKPKGKPRGRPFAPGQSGNPSGRPKDVLGIQRYAREFGPEAIDRLVELMRKAQSESARGTASIAILDRGCGKPTQPTEGRLDVTYLVRDEPMPMDEWRKRFAE
jgi:hypothetical protein